ncbi:mutator type transposase [Tanacetum coccineum]
MVKLSVDLNKPKDSSKTDKAAQNGRVPKSLTLEIHHGGWFTPTPSRSYIGGQVSLVNVVDIDVFCLHDLKDMVVKLGYGVEDLMYCHFLIPSLGLDYGLHSLNVDVDVLEMTKYVKNYTIILVYVEYGSSIVDTSMFDSSPDVNRNVRKKWEKVSSKSSSIGEVMKKLSKEQPASSVARPIVVESVVDPFDGLDEILGDYANTGKQITRDESTWKQMVVHIGTSSTADDFSFGKFKEVEVEADTESEEEESDTEGNDTSGSDFEDLDYDPKHDDVFDDDEHIVEEVHVNMNNFSFTADPKHDTSIGGVDVQDDDLDVINYDSFGSDLDDGIDSERRIQLRELRRIGKQKKVETRRQLILVKNNNERVRVRCEATIPALVPYVAIENNTYKNVFSQIKGGPAIRENTNSGKQNILGKDKTVEGKGKKKGQILTAVMVDANNEIYPVAYVIVEAESKASWCWFLNLLGEDLGIEANFNYTFISDRQKGLIQAIARVFLNAEHRYCVRHIHENIKSRFKGGVYKEML